MTPNRRLKRRSAKVHEMHGFCTPHIAIDESFMMKSLTPIRRSHCAVLLAGLVLSSAINTPLRAETQPAQASASIEIITPLSVSVEQTLSFGRLQVRKGSRVIVATIEPNNALKSTGLVVLPGGTPSALRATIKGEPNRSYRISLPASVLSSSGSFRVSAFTMVSATRNNIPINGSGLLNANGVEVLRIGGTLLLSANARLAVYTAQVPITVLYE